jgi:hypothetical protein
VIERGPVAAEMRAAALKPGEFGELIDNADVFGAYLLPGDVVLRTSNSVVSIKSPYTWGLDCTFRVRRIPAGTRLKITVGAGVKPTNPGIARGRSK